MVLTLCPYSRDFTEFELQRIPIGLTHHISKGVTLRTSYARYECMEILYHELVAFIPNAKDDWDFCLGGLNLMGF
ncbi:hypothetical protein [Helicobacter pylori]|uniref:hypothetical protein n=1 Tax=Helicobacter pylori TaxID=210 RepID=UPI00165B4B5A